MKVDVPFDIGEKVKIIELNRFGYVMAIQFSYLGARYDVHYIDDGEKKSAYFIYQELSKDSETSNTGFLKNNEIK